MAQTLTSIKDFLATCSRDDVESVTVKYSANDTKFKIRCPRMLYTLTVDERSKADKIVESLPSSLKIIKVGK
ncbi:60S ribosomal protein [Yarrowia sp. B02]|nr:60S ribosomal protein [Yarrowia sp. B02]